MRYAVASLALALSFVPGDATPAAAQVLPPQHAARVFLPIAGNRRPVGAYAPRPAIGWRDTDAILDVLRWDGLAFDIRTYKRVQWFAHYETAIVDRATGRAVYVFQDQREVQSARSEADGSQLLFVENVGLGVYGLDVQPFRRYADALIAECRADAACDQSTIEWRGVTP